MIEPLTSPECDLRDYPWMPLDCTRLLTSETWILGSAEQKVAALTLWCKSWHQVPAGSLPENDRMLEVLSEAGARWPKVREHAIRGWVKCSDGRLYHPVVAEKANYSWALKLKQRARTDAARASLDAKRRAATDARNAPVTETVTDIVTEPGNPLSAEVNPAGFYQTNTTNAQSNVITSAFPISITKAEIATDRGQVSENTQTGMSVTETVTGSIRTEQNRTEQESKKAPPVAPPKASAPRAASPTPAGRGCRIADHWTPADPGFAAEHGVDQAAALAEFQDYWRGVAGKAGVKLDWEATWRNQIRHLSAKRGGRLPVKTSQMSVPDQNAELLRLMARHLQVEDETPVPQLRIVQ